MGMKNDLAFIIDTELFLYEHQSTYNPNMPLRDLFYISSEYQKLVDKKSLYSSVLQKITCTTIYRILQWNRKEKIKAEVIAMSIFEYDKEEEERKLRKAEYEAGVESGIAEGKRLAQKRGYDCP